VGPAPGVRGLRKLRALRRADRDWGERTGVVRHLGRDQAFHAEGGVGGRVRAAVAARRRTYAQLSPDQNRQSSPLITPAYHRVRSGHRSLVISHPSHSLLARRHAVSFRTREIALSGLAAPCVPERGLPVAIIRRGWTGRRAVRPNTSCSWSAGRFEARNGGQAGYPACCAAQASALPLDVAGQHESLILPRLIWNRIAHEQRHRLPEMSKARPGCLLLLVGVGGGSPDPANRRATL
jgi:hypothetical protein